MRFEFILLCMFVCFGSMSSGEVSKKVLLCQVSDYEFKRLSHGAVIPYINGIADDIIKIDLYESGKNIVYVCRGSASEEIIDILMYKNNKLYRLDIKLVKIRKSTNIGVDGMKFSFVERFNAGPVLGD